MLNSLTGRQANVIEHALAYPKMTRNRFETKIGSLNDETWLELVAVGRALIVSTRSEEGKTTYSVTESGITAIREYNQHRTNQSGDVPQSTP